MDKSIGDMITKLRTENKQKQDVLARNLNLSRSTISQYENNDRIPSLETAQQIAKIYNVSIDYLCNVHEFKYDPRHDDFKHLMTYFLNCDKDQKDKIIKYAKRLSKEGNNVSKS